MCSLAQFFLPCRSVQIHHILIVPVGLLLGMVVGVGISQVTNTK